MSKTPALPADEGDEAARSPVAQAVSGTPREPTDAGCRAAMLTPPGRGAIATIGVVGPQVARVVAARFQAASGCPLDETPCERIVFGRWASDETAAEEVVVVRRAPDRVEIHCHGGRAAAAAILRSLKTADVGETSWQQLMRECTPDALEAEARIALSAVRTERAAAILLDQWRGALRRALAGVARLVRQGLASEAAETLRELDVRSDVGLHLVEPWRIVLTGRPNVGKSSLVNALLGFERCIVHDQPGTTRDVVTASTALDGWPVELADTGGWRDADDEIEAAGLAQAAQQLRQADLVVTVFDLSAPWTSDDDRLGSAWPRALIVHNKCDLPPSVSSRRPAGLIVSAARGIGIEPLIDALAQRLVPRPPPPGAAVPYTRDQVGAIRAARAALAAGDTDGTLELIEAQLAG